VIYRVRALHQFYQRHLLLPSYVRELRVRATNAREAAKNKRTDDLKGNLRQCDALLDRIPKYADEKLKDHARNTRQSIARFLEGKRHNWENDCHGVIDEIEATVTSASTFLGEDKWATKK